MQIIHSTTPKGNVSLLKIARRNPAQGLARKFSLKEVFEYGYPQKGLDRVVNEWREANWHRLRQPAYLLKFLTSLAGKLGPEVRAFSELYLKAVRGGQVQWLGLASLRVVTTAGVNFIVDAFQNTVEVENLKFHGLGTGTNAEAAADTALQTELTTEYQTNNTRPTGTTTEGASANVYRTVATNTVDASAAVTEHGIFSQAATGGGTLLDRSVFSVVNLVSGDSLQSTYDLTFTAGS